MVLYKDLIVFAMVVIEYKCPRCENEIALMQDQDAVSPICPCGATMINITQPDVIIPFKFDKYYAEKILASHLQGKILLPSLFKTQSYIESIIAVYIPCWLFDCSASADLHCQGIKKSFLSDSAYNYTKTDYYSINRQGTAFFENVPVKASLQIDNVLMESIEPFSYTEALEFQGAHLDSYTAYAKDLDSAKAKLYAVERIKKTLESLIVSTVRSYSRVTLQSSSVQVHYHSIRCAFVPVWIVKTIYKDRTYSFAINGQNGNFAGELPLSRPRFWACLVCISAVLFLLGMLLLR